MPRSIARRCRISLGIALLAACLAVPLHADDQGASNDAWNAAVNAPIHSRIKVTFRDGRNLEGRLAAILDDAVVVDEIKIGPRGVILPRNARLEDGLTIHRDNVASVSILSTARPPQPTAATFEQLEVLVRSGDKVQVMDSAGSRMSGTIVKVSPSLLSLKVGNSIRDLPQSDVALVQQRRGDSLVNGALTGLASGAGFGLAMCARCHAGPGLVAAGLYGGIGAGIGVGIDAMLRSDVVLFQKKLGTGARISVVPRLANSHKGVTVSVRF